MKKKTIENEPMIIQLDDEFKGLGIEELGNPGIAPEEESPIDNAITPEMYEKIRKDINNDVKKLLEGKKTREPTSFQTITKAIANNGAGLEIGRREVQLPEYEDSELKVLLNKIPLGASMRQIVQILSTVKRVNYVKFFGPDGNGTIVYF